MRQILLIISFLAAISTTNAKDLKFDTENWDFGTIEETGGKVSHTFTFKNTAKHHVVIHSVRTSCGCTTPQYSRKPIPPGESSSIEITFDPEFRPGVFDKDIYIYNTATPEPLILKITGTVSPRVLSLKERYPYTLESVARISNQYVSFRAVPHGRSVQQIVEFKNVSTKPFDIEFKTRNPKSILQLYYDRKVESQEDATLEVGYYLEEDSQLAGRIYDTVDIFIDGKRAEKMLYIKGLVVE